MAFGDTDMSDEILSGAIAVAVGVVFSANELVRNNRDKLGQMSQTLNGGLCKCFISKKHAALSHQR